MTRALWSAEMKRLLRLPARRNRRVWQYRPCLDVLEERLPPAITLSITNPAPLPEGDSGTRNMMFIVTRSGDLTPAVQVDYATRDGTAVAGTDYTATSGTLSFATNQTTATIAVPIVGNRIFQSNRAFTVGLSNPRSNVVDFAPQRAFATGGNPRYIAVGDLNRDSKPDLAVANFFSNTLSVLLNTTPAGAAVPSFASQQTFTTGNGPHGIAVGDFNSDGNPDLVIVSEFGNTVSVLLNTTPAGAATPRFAPQRTFPVGSSPFSVAVDDFNGDGKQDLAIANFSSATVSVLLNTTPAGAATPSFSPQQTFATGRGSAWVAVGDFNNDRKPDLAVTNEGLNTVSVLLNTTSAGAAIPSFASQRTFATGNYPLFAAVEDFNRDGKSDLAITNHIFETVSVLLNTTPAGATVPSFAPQQAFPVGNRPSYGAVGDFNGDGKPDFVVPNTGSATVSVLLNVTPTGAAIPSFASQRTFGTGLLPGQMAVADFNGDGKSDLAVTNDGAATVSVLLNNAVSITVTGSPAAGTIQDDDAPAAIAIVAGNNQTATVAAAFVTNLSVDIRNAAGSLVQGVSVTFTPPANGPSGTFAGSATVLTNVSGRATAPNFTANTVAGSYTVTARASGGSNPPTNFTLTNAPANVSRFVVAAPASVPAGMAFPFTVMARDPFNNLATGYRSTVAFTSSDIFASLPGNYTFTAADAGTHTFMATLRTAGDQTITARDTINGTLNGSATVTVAFTPFQPPTYYPAGIQPRDVAQGDFNGDGWTDLVTADSGSNTLSVLLNSANGTYAKPLPLPAGLLPVAVVVADFNGDMFFDLAAANHDGNTVTVYLGAGDGSFFFIGEMSTGLAPASIVAADFDNDGLMDLMTANEVVTLSLLRGRGDGTFADPEDYLSGGSPSGLLVADLNGDGILDVATANPGNDTISVLLGNGDGTFRIARNYRTGAGPAALAAADFNGDGCLDLVTADTQDGTVSVLLNNCDGTFALAKSFAAGPGPVDVVVDDFDLDGLVDLAVAHVDYDLVTVLLGNAEGTFRPGIHIAVEGGPLALTACDCNGDGVADLAVAIFAYDSVAVLYGMSRSGGAPSGGGDGGFMDRSFVPTTTMVVSASRPPVLPIPPIDSWPISSGREVSPPATGRRLPRIAVTSAILDSIFLALDEKPWLP